MGSIKKPKDKTAAVVLAIFLGICAWIYTWHKDWWKFVVAIGINIFLFWTILVPIGIYIWVIADTASKPREWYRDYTIKY